MNRKHKQEMIRFANSPEGTKTWINDHCGNWYLISRPNWINENTYILDDEFATIRKQFIDDPSKVEYNYTEDKWGAIKEFLSETSFEYFTRVLCNDSDRFRIKPITETRWQWIYLKPTTNIYCITKLHYTSDKNVIDSIGLKTNHETIKKIEESAKEFEV